MQVWKDFVAHEGAILPKQGIELQRQAYHRPHTEFAQGFFSTSEGLKTTAPGLGGFLWSTPRGNATTICRALTWRVSPEFRLAATMAGSWPHSTLVTTLAVRTSTMGAKLL